MKKKVWLVMVVALVMAMMVCIGCSGDGGEGANSEAVNSDVVSENAADIISSEEVSEVVSDEPESASTEGSEDVAEEEPVIVNVILTREEADAYIEDLKVKYPEMSEETIVMLFVNFNIHSLDNETILYYTNTYDCITQFENTITKKLRAILRTRANKDGEKYNETWYLGDFITNEELRKFAEEIEVEMYNATYNLNDEEFDIYCQNIDEYMCGSNIKGFMFDYNSEQRESTDLDSICYFMACYNFIYNSDKLGFSDLASQEVLYTPVEKYQMEQEIEE